MISLEVLVEQLEEVMRRLGYANERLADALAFIPKALQDNAKEIEALRDKITELESEIFLTRKKLYAMVFRGDFLEIVNLEALRG